MYGRHQRLRHGGVDQHPTAIAAIVRKMNVQLPPNAVTRSRRGRHRQRGLPASGGPLAVDEPLDDPPLERVRLCDLDDELLCVSAVAFHRCSGVDSP
jgi:hypothetical protein